MTELAGMTRHLINILSISLSVRDMQQFFAVGTLCHAVTLTFDPLTLNFYSTSSVLCLKSVQNLSKIE